MTEIQANRKEVLAALKQKLEAAHMKLESPVELDGRCIISAGANETRVNHRCKIESVAAIADAIASVNAAVEQARETNARAQAEMAGEYYYTRPDKGHRQGDLVPSDLPLGQLRTLRDCGIIKRVDAPPSDKSLKPDRVRNKAVTA